MRPDLISIFLIPVLIVTGSVLRQDLPRTGTGTNQIDGVASPTGLIKFFNQSTTKKCFVPFLSAHISENGLPPDLKKLSGVCDLIPTGKQQEVGLVELCTLIEDMLSRICAITQNALPQNESSLRPFNTTLFDVLKTYQDKTVDVFCSQLTQDDRISTSTDLKLKPELQTFYGDLLLKNIPSDNRTSNNGSCLSVCQNHPDAAIEEFNLKINPLCIVFNFTSIVYNSVSSVQINGELSSSSTGNDAVKEKVSQKARPEDNTGTAKVSKRMNNSFKAEAHEKVEGTSAEVKESSTKLKAPAEHPSLSMESQLTKAQSPGPEIQKVIEETPRKPFISKVESSSRPSPVVDEFEATPPLINKNSVASNNKNDDNRGGQSSTKVEVSKGVSGDKTNKAPLDKNNDEDMDDQLLPAQVDGDNDYAVSQNLEGSEEIPDAKNNAKSSDPISVVSNAVKNDTPNRKETFKYQSNIENYDAEAGGYFNYFVFIVTFFALLFLACHNKRRLVAYIIEGRKPRGSRSRRRSSSVSETSYRRLENNFE